MPEGRVKREVRQTDWIGNCIHKKAVSSSSSISLCPCFPAWRRACRVQQSLRATSGIPGR